MTNEKNASLPDLDAARVGRARADRRAVRRDGRAARICSCGRWRRRSSGCSTRFARRRSRRVQAQRPAPPADAAAAGGRRCSAEHDVDFHAIVPMLCVTAAAHCGDDRRGVPRRPASGCRSARSASSASSAPPSRRRCSGTATPTSFGVVVADNFGLFVTWILIVVGLLSLAFSAPTIEREGLPAGEYYALMLFALAGMMLMATATDLLVIFLALEVLSLAVYVLTGIRRDSPVGDGGGVQVLPARRVLAARSSSTASRSPTALTGSTRLDRIGSADGRAGDGADADAAARASACCSSASRSRCRRCRSTCGRPTPTKARRPRSPASCRPA